MADSKKMRKVITLTAGAAALGLSATAITVMHRTDATNQVSSAVPKSLRDGAVKVQVSADKSSWVGIAKND
jgi:hypothetical protein